jgi:ribosomal protein S18 acetylase RimI-like enzyme
MMNIIQAETEFHFEQARILFEEYAALLNIDLAFQDFDTELEVLERMYGPPNGRILLAFDEENTAGCIAVRALSKAGEGACEMKRLYVRPSYRGSGLGRRLAERVLKEACRLGYDRMLLDSLEQMERARALYRTVGFSEIAPYYDNPFDNVKYMEVQLGDY